jgi:hypothetical protein
MLWRDIDLDRIPTIHDFSIELRALEDLGEIVHFVSGAHGELAWFPAWEHAERDLRHFEAGDVPFGSIDDPYEDADEGWRIVIFEHGGHVYILEDDSPTSTRFPRRFRIPRDRYFAAWAALISGMNPILGLDDVMGEEEPE